MHAIFDESGLPRAFYDPALGVTAPPGAVEITGEQWLDLIEHPGQRRWDGSGVVVYTPPPPPLDLDAYARNRRWELETAGTEVSGVLIRTDIQSRTNLTGAIQLLDADPGLSEVDWEAQPGQWITLDAQVLRNMGIAVGRHVQRCFSALRAIQASIAAGTITNAADIDAAFAAAIAQKD